VLERLVEAGIGVASGAGGLKDQTGGQVHGALRPEPPALLLDHDLGADRAVEILPDPVRQAFLHMLSEGLADVQVLAAGVNLHDGLSLLFAC